MSILDRTALEASPLADLHEIASELSIDGYRRLRRGDLVAAILRRQSGEDASSEADDAEDEAGREGEESTATATSTEDGDGGGAPEPRPSRARRGLRARASARDTAETVSARDSAETDSAETESAELSGSEREPETGGSEPETAVVARADTDGEPIVDAGAETAGAETDGAETDVAETDVAETAGGEASPAAEPVAAPDDDEHDRDEDGEPAGTRRRRGRRGGRGRANREDQAPADVSAVAAPAGEAAEETDGDEAGHATGDEPIVEGVVELLANGSGFVRVDPPDPSDDDVYISSAQVKRCELVSGDRIIGPKRAPRRSERFASLIRIETINGRPASELADSVRFDDLPVAFPDERLKIGSEDPTLKAIEWLTPFGKGSRVTIVGAARAGKTEALKRLAAALVVHEELTVTVVLAGVRPEELADWNAGPAAPVAAVTLGASEDAQNGAIEPVIDQARRLATRGADALVLIDSLDGCSPHLARKAMASARNIVDGGSVTVIATASAPIGGETTVISLDVGQASIGRFPALDLTVSGTIRPELLLGEAGAEAITRTRAEAAGIE